MKTITFDEFDQVELRSGIIIHAEDFPKARKPAFKITADFGEEIGKLTTSAQVKDLYKLDDLIGKRIVGCVNLGEKNIAGFLSQFLIVGFKNEQGHVTLLSSDHSVPNGSKLC